MAMLIPALPANAIPGPDDSIKYSELPDTPIIPPPTPDTQTIELAEHFTTWIPAGWTVDNYGTGAAALWAQYTLDSSEVPPDGYCAYYFTGAGAINLDWLNTSVDLSGYVNGPCSVAWAQLEFDYLTDSAYFEVGINGVFSTMAATPTWTHVTTALPVGATVDISPNLGTGRRCPSARYPTRGWLSTAAN